MPTTAQPEAVTFHFDAGCPWTWLTSRWLLRAAEAAGFTVEWGTFSLAHLNRGKEIPEQYRAFLAAGVACDRVVRHLIDRGDQAGVGAFYEAWGTLVHRNGGERSVEAVRGAVKEAGLDDDAVAAVDDESLDEAVGVATDAAMAKAGPDIGSPVLSWTEADGKDVAIFGPIIDEVPETEIAVEIWRGVRHLAAHGVFKELKRGRTGHPNVAAS